MPVEKVTTRQMILFLIITRVSIAISVMPAINLPPFNQDTWIMTFVSLIYTFIAMIPILFLANKFTDYSMIGYTKLLFGNTMGKILGILYGLNFMMIAINGITIQSELVASTILTSASNITIIIFMIITCIYLVSRGIITFTRSTEFLTPVSMFVIISLLLLGVNNVDFNIIFPVLKDSSLMDISDGAIRLAFFYNDIFLLAMLVPELENKKNINKIFIISTTLSLLFLAISILMVFGTVGIEFARHSNFPFLLYTRTINSFKIFERIESIFVLVWLITSLTRIAGFIYIATRSFRELFNKKEEEKPILFIVGAIVGIVSMLILNMRSVIGVRKYFDLYFGILFVIFVIGLPILTCIVYFFKRKSIDMKEKPKS